MQNRTHKNEHKLSFQSYKLEPCMYIRVHACVPLFLVKLKMWTLQNCWSSKNSSITLCPNVLWWYRTCMILYILLSNILFECCILLDIQMKKKKRLSESWFTVPKQHSYSLFQSSIHIYCSMKKWYNHRKFVL